MTNGNSSMFYFKVEDIKQLLAGDATHIVINATTGEADTYSDIVAEVYDAAATPKGTKLGCPWPCGGGTSGTAITRESLEYAQQVLSGSPTQQQE